MDLDELTGLIAVFMGTSMLLIPIAGLTLRFAIKPAVEQIARALSEIRGGRDDLAAQRAFAMEEDLRDLRKRVARLTEDQDFRRRLEEPVRRVDLAGS